MPQATNYKPIISLISSIRLDGYRTTFRPNNECELYGIYIWSQHAAASIYPLLQNLEISLRNAVDREARVRFGDMWWETIHCTKDRDECHFYKKHRKAKECLTREWRKKRDETQARSLCSGATGPGMESRSYYCLNGF